MQPQSQDIVHLPHDARSSAPHATNDIRMTLVDVGELG